MRRAVGAGEQIERGELGGNDARRADAVQGRTVLGGDRRLLCVEGEVGEQQIDERRRAG